MLERPARLLDGHTLKPQSMQADCLAEHIDHVDRVVLQSSRHSGKSASSDLSTPSTKRPIRIPISKRRKRIGLVAFHTARVISRRIGSQPAMPGPPPNSGIRAAQQLTRWATTRLMRRSIVLR